MSFFENFTEKAKMYANMAAEKAKDVAEVAADKAKDVKETAQLTMAIKSEQRELDKNYRAIGQWFASEYEGEIPDAIKDVMAAIEASRTKIEEMEAALAEKRERAELALSKLESSASPAEYFSTLAGMYSDAGREDCPEGVTFSPGDGRVSGAVERRTARPKESTVRRGVAAGAGLGGGGGSSAAFAQAMARWTRPGKSPLAVL